MTKMTPKSLVAAIVVLTQQGKHVTMIQFEDGSGYKFNYTDGPKQPEFIDMKSDDMTTEELELDIIKLKLKIMQTRILAENIVKDEYQ